MPVIAKKSISRVWLPNIASRSRSHFHLDEEAKRISPVAIQYMRSILPYIVSLVLFHSVFLCNYRWMFGNRTYATLFAIVTLLKKTPIKSKVAIRMYYVFLWVLCVLDYRFLGYHSERFTSLAQTCANLTWLLGITGTPMIWHWCDCT